MNFDYTDDQRMLRNEARKFLEARCPSAVVRGVLEDNSRSYDAALWAQIAEMGWLGSVIAEEYGGLGLNHIELCVIAEELGRALAPVPFASTVYVFVQALMLAGSAEQKARWLPRVAEGSAIGCMATAEGAGTVLPRRPGCYVSNGYLYGTKMPVIDGDVADVAIVLARENGADNLYLVDLGVHGLARSSLASLDPTRGLARLVFHGALAERLGETGAGYALARQVLDRAAALMAFEQLGGAERCLELAKEFALERYAFGRSIASYQAIKHKLADVYVRNELARSNAYYGAWALDQSGGEMALAAATARLAACDAYWHASKENIQIHGGMGFTWEVDAHLHYRRAQQLALSAGAPRYWKERLVAQLEARHAEANHVSPSAPQRVLLNTATVTA